ncbi:MAG: hypothetical protein IT364_06185 [Candidatus Hydrogenedentes bacterium]|nr:hypothetical protein [Candidatus Hydrogenedentota bacterium]
MPNIIRRIRNGLRGWRSLLAFVVLLVILVWLDQRTLAAAPVHGIRPQGAAWVLSTADFPGFWRRLAQGDVFQRMRKDWPRPQGAFELAMRLDTGVRPTPLRWRVWLGKRFTLAESQGEVGLCVFPGILLRTVDWSARIIGHQPDSDGIAIYGPYHYAWRDGFLIASRSRDYVMNCLVNGDAGPLRSGSDGELAFQWTGDHEGYMRTLPGPGLRVEGRVHMSLTDGEGPLSLTNAWPHSPVLSITARATDDLLSVAAVVQDAADSLPAWAAQEQLLSTALSRWDTSLLPENWDAGVHHAAFALLDVSVEDTLPIPDAALVLRGGAASGATHPLAPLASGHASIPYEWEGQPGLYIPWLGEQLSPCLGRSGRDWIVTLNEPSMAALAGSLSPGPAETADVDLAVRMSWEKAGKAAQGIARSIAYNSLLPRMNAEETRRALPPKIDALSRLGALHINARAEGEWLSFDGNLCDPAKRAGD